MDNSRMSTADMLQYCDEALSWEAFGPIDIFFFESVKKIILGQCSPMDRPEDEIDDLMGIERPVGADELAPDYDKYADVYYGEEGDDDVPDYSSESDDEAFGGAMFSEGFFVTEDEVAAPFAETKPEQAEPEKASEEKPQSGSDTVNN